jgi:hypothetical protein
VLVNDFTSTDPERLDWPSYVGLQNHGNGENVLYRDVQIKELADPENVAPTVTVTPTPATVEVGKTAQVQVRVDSPAEETPTGEVTVSVDGQPLAPATLVDGTATVTVGPFSSVGTVALAASYDGDVAHDPADGEGVLTVKEKTVVPPQPPVKAGVATVGTKVDANKARKQATIGLKCLKATCRVTATLVQAGGKSLGSGKITLQAGKRGKLKLTLTALARTRLKAKASVPATLVVKHADGRTQKLKVRLTR